MYDIKLYKFLSDFVFNNTGILYVENDFYRLDSRIQNLIKHFGLKDADELYSLMQNQMNNNNKSVILDVCTNNETFFFRDQKPFEALKAITSDIWKEKPMEKLYIWSAACSTGQEPLSIIMTLKELKPNLTRLNLEIDATDISTAALAKAKRGNYSTLDVQRGLPIVTLVDNFDQEEDDSWTARSALRDLIDFKQFNLLNNIYPVEKYHFIFCRNVLIYQNMENKELILNNLYRSLKPGGYLIMGAGESLIGTHTSFVPAKVDYKMFFHKPLE